MMRLNRRDVVVDDVRLNDLSVQQVDLSDAPIGLPRAVTGRTHRQPACQEAGPTPTVSLLGRGATCCSLWDATPGFTGRRLKPASAAAPVRSSPIGTLRAGTMARPWPVTPDHQRAVQLGRCAKRL